MKFVAVCIYLLAFCSCFVCGSTCNKGAAQFAVAQLIRTSDSQIVGEVQLTVFPNDTLAVRTYTLQSHIIKHVVMHVAPTRNDIPKTSVMGSANYAAFEHSEHLTTTSRINMVHFQIDGLHDNCCLPSVASKPLFAMAAYASVADSAVPAVLLVANTYRLGDDVSSGTFMSFPKKCEAIA